MESHGASPHLSCYRISVDFLIALQLEVYIVHGSKFGLTPHISQSYKRMGEGRGILRFRELKTHGLSSGLVSTDPHVPALISTAPRKKLVSKVKQRN